MLDKDYNLFYQHTQGMNVMRFQVMYTEYKQMMKNGFDPEAEMTKGTNFTQQMFEVFKDMSFDGKNTIVIDIINTVCKK